MIRFNPTVPVAYYVKTAVYVEGEGQSVTWVSLGTLYAEWRGAYGDRVTAAQAMGVNDSATIRTHYHPEIYANLRTSQVIAVKNADASAIVSGVPDPGNANVYEVWGGVDNVGEENRYMELRVRRYEGK